MPNFVKFGDTTTSRQYGEMYTSRSFYTFYSIFVGKLYRKNTQQFQALNGLERSTVGNLGSYGHSL